MKSWRNRNDLVMGLLQNCDLPPPAKVFSGSDERVISLMNRGYGLMGEEEEEDDDNEKLELLKALRRSQTRARESERKAANLAGERDRLCEALLRESARCYVSGMWVKMLEAESLRLKVELMEVKGNGNEDEGGLIRVMALAFCLGIAGVGFVFGCKYLF